MFIHVHLFTSLRKSASFKLSTVKENPLRGLTYILFMHSIGQTITL